MRPLLPALALLVAAGASAQAPAAVGPGDRVRVFYGPGDLPVGGSSFTGVLRAAGDTLVIETDGGPVIRPRREDLARIEVSAGRRPFPYWLVGLGAAAGATGGYLLADSASSYDVCLGAAPDGSRECAVVRDDLEFHFVATVVTAGSVAVATLVAARLSAERWTPAGRFALTAGGISWDIGL